MEWNKAPSSLHFSLLSNRIGVHKDNDGAIFIDRDPDLFSLILTYLRTKRVDFGHYPLAALIHEAQFYNIGPLIKRLTLCDELVNQSPCGDVLFHAYLNPPQPPLVGGRF